MIGRRKNKVLMQIEAGPSIEGILMLRTRTHYILRAPTILKDDGTSYRVDGEIRIPVRRVLFFQVLTS